MLGTVLSRAVVAASPFFGTLAAGAVLVVLHRLLAWAAYRNDFVGKIIKGDPTLLARQGSCYPKTLAKPTSATRIFTRACGKRLTWIR